MSVEATKEGTLYMQIMHFCKKEIGNLAHRITTHKHVPNLLISKKNFWFQPVAQDDEKTLTPEAKNNLEWKNE